MGKSYQPNCVLLAQLLKSADGIQETGFISLDPYIAKIKVCFSLTRVYQELFLKSLTQFQNLAFLLVSSGFIICMECRQDDQQDRFQRKDNGTM